jgi:hypothetical protein
MGYPSMTFIDHNLSVPSSMEKLFGILPSCSESAPFALERIVQLYTLRIIHQLYCQL